jgi:hypothetical protein
VLIEGTAQKLRRESDVRAENFRHRASMKSKALTGEVSPDTSPNKLKNESIRNATTVSIESVASVGTAAADSRLLSGKGEHKIADEVRRPNPVDTESGMFNI